MRKVFEEKKIKQNKIPQTYGNFLFSFWCNILIVRHVSEIKKIKNKTFIQTFSQLHDISNNFGTSKTLFLVDFVKKKMN